MVVDAIDDAAVSFYEKHGFEADSRQSSAPRPEAVNVAAALELDWP